MVQICTLADRKYISQLDLMIKSSGVEMLNIHLLCLDAETHFHFRANAICYDSFELFANVENVALIDYKNSHTYEQYCWALASYFMNFLRKRGIGDLLYIDADIYFYKPVSTIKFDMSIGLIEHRFKSFDKSRRVGHYNVSLIYFKDDEESTDCLAWWSNWVIDDTNIYFKEYGTCGDQKYLELFDEMWDGVKVINIGHAAPWNVNTQQLKNKNITFQGLTQPLTFFHFSHFSVSDSGYVTNRNGEWFPERVAWAKELYDEYYKLLK